MEHFHEILDTFCLNDMNILIFWRINLYVLCEHAIEVETYSCTHSIQQLYVKSDRKMYGTRLSLVLRTHRYNNENKMTAAEKLNIRI